MTSTDDLNLVTIGESPVPVLLNPPHTLESVKERAKECDKYRPFLCRIRLHKWEVIGEPYQPENDVVTLTLAVISYLENLQQCKRCGALRQKYYPW